MKTCYLAGPMTGLPEHNYPAFKKAAEVLRRMGWAVISPAELHPEAINTPPEEAALNRPEYLSHDLQALLLPKCHAIVLLPNWHESAGALLEAWVALQTGKHIYSLWNMGEAYGVSHVGPEWIETAIRDHMIRKSLDVMNLTTKDESLLPRQETLL